MSSFRAITGEEEAAAAVFKALQLRGYPQSQLLSVKDHTHKAAALACALAIRSSIAMGVKNIKVEFDFKAVRIDVKIPLRDLNIRMPGGADLALQPVEPLDLLRAREDDTSDNVYADDLKRLAEGAKFSEIKHMVKSQANARNTLLYASNRALPRSHATKDTLLSRKENALMLISVAVIALQTTRHQAMLRQGIEALLAVVERLPKMAIEPDEL